MNHIYSDHQINAHFSVQSLENYRIENAVPAAHQWFSVFIINQLDGSAMVDDQEFSTEQPSVLFITPGQYLSLKFVVNWDGYVVSFNKEFYCIEYHDSEISCNGLLFVNNYRIVNISLDSQQQSVFNNTVREIAREFESGDELLAELLKNLLKNLLIRSNRLFKQQFTEVEVDEPNFDIVRKLSSLIEMYYTKEKQVEVYAGMMGMSASSLTKKLQLIGVGSPSQILRERIITEAKRLLIYSEKSIKEISFILGYDDPHYFSRLFSNSTGMPASDYRKMHS